MRLKKYLSVVLSASLCLTGLGFGQLEKTKAADTVTEINSVEGLKNITNDPNGNFKLTADIDLTEATKTGGAYDSGHGWASLVDSKVGFKGTLDGDGHKIIGMHIYGNCGAKAGFISELSGGTIKNLGLVDCNIENIQESAGGEIRLGALVGRCASGTIENCFVTGNITATRAAAKTAATGKITTAEIYIGGIAGVDKGTITNCYSGMNIFVNSQNPGDGGKFYVGGIAGYNTGSKVTTCYQTGAVPSLDASSNVYAYAITGMAGLNENCYFLKNVEVTESSIPAGPSASPAASVAPSASPSASASPAAPSAGASGAPQAAPAASPDAATVASGSSVIVDTKKTIARKTVTAGNYENIDLYATALTDSQFRVQSYFAGFDFENTWILDPWSSYKYPQLKSNFQVELAELNWSSATTVGVINCTAGSELNLTGLLISFKYKDGTEVKDIQVPSYMVSGYDKTKTGQQTVTISWGGKTLPLVVNVAAVPVEKVTLSASKTTLSKGDVVELTAAFEPANATQTTFVWTTSNSQAITITPDSTDSTKAKATAVGGGTVTITATAPNGVKGTVKLTSKVPCTSITLNATSLTMNKGKTKQLIATVNPSDTTSKLTWNSSNKKVATVDANGLVTIVGTGKVNIAAKCTTDGVKALCKIKAVLPIKKGVIASKSNISGRKLRVKAKKLTYATGYQIRYSRYSTMSSAAKKTSTSKTITSGKLTKGKKYYVQVRGYYTTTTGSKFYGAWSKTAAVTIWK